jgi:hypothetical protein
VIEIGLALIRGIVDIVTGSKVDAQKREASQMVSLRDYLQKGADELSLLIASRTEESAKTDEAFEEARKRIAAAHTARLPSDEETTKP